MALAFSYAMFQGGFVSWFLFYSFLPFGLFAFFLAFYSLGGFRAERIMLHKEFSAGEKGKVNIVIKRRSRFPLPYMIVEDVISEKLKDNGAKTKKVFFPMFKQQFSFEYTIEKLPRGEHLFKGIRLKTGDFLGLVEKEWLMSTQDKIIVYPTYEELSYSPIESQFDQGSTAANERIHRDSSMSVGIREYQPGDRFSWINWKATAKRNDFMTKEFEQRKSHDVMVVMDCASHPHFEVLVTYTASTTRAIIRKGAQVGLLTVSDERVMIPVRSGEAHQKQLFFHLAKIAEKSPVSFSQALEGEAFLGRQYSSILLITAGMTQELVDKVGFYAKASNTISLIIIKGKQETASKKELALISSARAKGINVKIAYEGRLAEVSGG